jgi:hypothetical protein
MNKQRGGILHFLFPPTPATITKQERKKESAAVFCLFSDQLSKTFVHKLYITRLFLLD